MRLEVGTRIYNHGDMANPSHFGTVTALIPATRFAPESLEITRDEHEEGYQDVYTIYAMSVDSEFQGHSGTRIVTEAEYLRWRQSQTAALAR